MSEPMLTDDDKSINAEADFRESSRQEHKTYRVRLELLRKFVLWNKEVLVQEKNKKIKILRWGSHTKYFFLVGGGVSRI